FNRWGAADGPCIVDDNINRREELRLVKDFYRSLLGCKISLNGGRSPSKLPYFLASLAGRPRVAVADHISSCFRQRDGNGCAQTRRCSRHQRCFAIKFEPVEDHRYFLLASSPEPV